MSDGSTYRAHLLIHFKRTKQKPVELEQPILSSELKKILIQYSDLRKWVDSINGVKKITAIELKAWLDITKRNLNAWQIEALKAIDKEVTNG